MCDYVKKTYDFLDKQFKILLLLKLCENISCSL